MVEENELVQHCPDFLKVACVGVYTLECVKEMSQPFENCNFDRVAKIYLKNIKPALPICPEGESDITFGTGYLYSLLILATKMRQ